MKRVLTPTVFASLILAAVTAVSAEDLKLKPSADTAAETYLGKVEGGPKNAQIAVLVAKKGLNAYVCSTDDDFNQTYASWFEHIGDWKPGVPVELSNGELRLRLQVEKTEVTGELTLAGKESLKVSASLAPADGLCGLYCIKAKEGDEEIVSGWIVGPDRFAVGSQLGLKTKRIRTLQGQKGIKGTPATNVGGKRATGLKVKNIGPKINNFAIELDI